MTWGGDVDANANADDDGDDRAARIDPGNIPMSEGAAEDMLRLVEEGISEDKFCVTCLVRACWGGGTPTL